MCGNSGNKGNNGTYNIRGQGYKFSEDSE